MKLAYRLLAVLDSGPRKPNVLLGVVKAAGGSLAKYERAIGWLFLKGLIVPEGRTSGRLIARNRRAK